MITHIGNFLYMSLLVLVVGLWIVLRWKGLLPRTRSQSRSNPVRRPCRSSRWAEGTMLVAVSLGIGAYTATNTNTGGYLLKLEYLKPELAQTHIWLALALLLGLVLSYLIAFLRSPCLGVIGCSLTVCVYATLLNGPREILERLAPGNATQRRILMRFSLGQSDIKNAELWVNDTRIGILPCEVTWSEFVKIVPYWEQKPKDVDRTEIPDILRDYHPRGGGLRAWGQWCEIKVKSPSDHRKSYYARVKFAGDWAYCEPSGDYSGSGSRYFMQYHHHLPFFFPDRERQLERLLDYARLKNYQVSDEWFQALDVFGANAVLSLRKKSSREPELGQLLEHWASWTYGLENARDGASAWRTFCFICDEVKKEQTYSTESLEGTAIEMLAPKLNVRRLTDYAINLIKSTRYLSASTWASQGKPHFGMSYSKTPIASTSDHMSSLSSGILDGQLPIEGYVVAHALWHLFQQEGSDAVTAFWQERLVPVFIAKFYRNLPSYGFLTHIGGATFEKFLLRQPWQLDPEKLPSRQTRHIHSGEVNAWFYMLANLESNAGRKFRQQQAQALFKLADQIAEIGIGDVPDNLGFLFLEPTEKSDSLPFRYWPRYRRLIFEKNPRDSDTVRYLYQYLIQMEPLSTPDMYCDVLFDFKGDDTSVSQGFKELAELPPTTRRQVYLALKETLENGTAHLEFLKDSDYAQQYLLDDLQRHLQTEQEEAQGHFNELAQGKRLHPILPWLEHARPDHALVSMLAQSVRPDSRKLALPALRSHPSPQNQALLSALLRDGDTEIREGAQKVKATWDQLAQMPLGELAADCGVREMERPK